MSTAVFHGSHFPCLGDYLLCSPTSPQEEDPTWNPRISLGVPLPGSWERRDSPGRVSVLRQGAPTSDLELDVRE